MEDLIAQTFRSKHVLVAGASGFIGTNLVKKLLSLGATVTGTYYENKNFFRHPNCKYIQANLEDKDSAFEVTKDADYVFMCAANTSGAAIIDKNPLIHLTPNVIMNARMLEAAYSNDVEKFCFISSNTVYPLTNSPVLESDVNYEFFHKYQIVGWMKLFSEKMCKMYSEFVEYPMDTVIVRPGNIYGPFDKFDQNKSKVIAALIRRAVEKEDPFEVWGDGKDVKDFIFIDDFITGMVAGFAHFGWGEEVNVASGRAVTIKEIIETIFELEELHNVELKFDPTKPTMIPKRLINIDKLQKHTGFSPQIDMREGLSRTIDWYKKYFSEKTPEELYRA
ncbi:NAD-dependent epimerase/dehydratase family protein [Alphaproteobacteria bacterium]|nr:NAD-dependent epimerase/dehydratase family protein [Alphaproteobacteria bacterium]